MGGDSELASLVDEEDRLAPEVERLWESKAVLKAKIDAQRPLLDACRDEVCALRNRLKEKETELAGREEAYTAMQVEHNAVMMKATELEIRLTRVRSAVQAMRKKAQGDKSERQSEAEEAWTKLLVKAEELGMEEADLLECDEEVLRRIAGNDVVQIWKAKRGEGCVHPSTEAAKEDVAEEAAKEDITEEAVLRCPFPASCPPPVPLPRGELRRTVCGEGRGFLEVIDRTRWEVVDDPAMAAIVWEREAQGRMAQVKGQDRGLERAWNRLLFETECRLVDKGELLKRVPHLLPESHPLSAPQHLVELARVAPSLKGVWILKRTDLASGFGLQVIDDVPRWWGRSCTALMETMRSSGARYILQRYITNPLLLKALPTDTVGRKHDMRMYFMVASPDPLVVLAYPGSIRMNIEEYRLADFGNRHIHISNIAQQRTHPKFHELQHVLKRTFDPQFKSRCVEMIREIITAYRSDFLRDAGRARFQLYAADFIATDDRKLWLMECQSGPALSHDDPVSAVQIPRLVNETLEVAYEVLRKTRAGESIALLESLRGYEVIHSECLR